MTVSTACQVDFYVLEEPSQSPEALACRLAMMSWEQGFATLVLAANAEEVRRLDEMMWQVPQGRFLPHAQLESGSTAPVIIGTPEQLGDGVSGLVINLTEQCIPQPQRFRRLLEIVPASEAQRQVSRDKFRAYRSQGLQPASHTMSAS